MFNISIWNKDIDIGVHVIFQLTFNSKNLHYIKERREIISVKLVLQILLSCPKHKLYKDKLYGCNIINDQITDKKRYYSQLIYQIFWHIQCDLLSLMLALSVCVKTAAINVKRLHQYCWLFSSCKLWLFYIIKESK